MTPFSCDQAAQAVGGCLLQGQGHHLLRGVSTDSRSLGKDDLFVALQGDRFDAHEFVSSQMSPAPGCVLVNQSRLKALPAGFPIIDVPDTRFALGRLARWYRSGFEIPVVGITGSNGKTSTKSILATVMGAMGKVHASPASFNNEIGVPLTLLGLDGNHQFLVVEIGTNHPGEIASLVELAKPTHGIITSIGGSHLGNFGSLDAIAKEKGALAEGLSEGGWLLLNGYRPRTLALGKRTRAKVITVGTTPDHDFQISRVEVSAKGTSFELQSSAHGFCDPVQIALHGTHQAINTSLALAAGITMGGNPQALIQAVAGAALPGMRMSASTLGSLNLWNDAYNANEDSVRSAIETFMSVAEAGRRKVVVLGELKELGVHGDAVYRRLGEMTASHGLESCVGIGQETLKWVETIREENPRKETFHFATLEEATQSFKDWLRPNDQVLLKASRGAKLEQLIAPLKAHILGGDDSPVGASSSNQSIG